MPVSLVVLVVIASPFVVVIELHKILYAGLCRGYLGKYSRIRMCQREFRRIPLMGPISRTNYRRGGFHRQGLIIKSISGVYVYIILGPKGNFFIGHIRLMCGPFMITPLQKSWKLKGALQRLLSF